MFRIVLTSICLLVSLTLSSRRMKAKAIAQIILSTILFILVLYLLPDAPFGFVIANNFGNETLALIHEALIDIEQIGISVVDIVNMAVLFVALLSVFDIAEYMQSKIHNEELPKKVTTQQCHAAHVWAIPKNNSYLLFCRLLS